MKEKKEFSLSDVDSHVLEIMSLILEGETDFTDDENTVEIAKWMFREHGDCLEFGELYDYDDTEDMEDYIEDEGDGRFCYNYYPDSDGTGVLFSTVELPNCETI